MISSAGVVGLGCGDDSDDGACVEPGQSVVVRKGASQMTPEEIERFQEAWALLVANGQLEQLAMGHTDIDNQRHHGAQIRGDYTADINPANYAQRFLAWHRAYVLDLEQAMRAALVADYRERGLDCAVADSVFVPYVDGAEYPQWLRDWLPTGTPTGVVVAHSDERITPNNGHESNGLAVGDTYEVVVRSYEGACPTCPTMPPEPRMIEEALSFDSFVDMSTWLEIMPGYIGNAPDPAQANVIRMAAEDIVDRDGANMMTFQSFMAIAGIIEAGGWTSENPMDRFVVVQALTALDRGRAFDEYGIQNWTDAQYEQVLGAVNTHIQRSPHAVLHFFAAGESSDPNEIGLYGSSAYFSDAGADPHFYMLHAELDRYFATWLADHDDQPPLEGDDRLFQTWPGATQWTLDELLDNDALPFAYDRLWSAS